MANESQNALTEMQERSRQLRAAAEEQHQKINASWKKREKWIRPVVQVAISLAFAVCIYIALFRPELIPLIFGLWPSP